MFPLLGGSPHTEPLKGSGDGYAPPCFKNRASISAGGGQPARCARRRKWEQWAGLPVDRTRPYSYRRSRIKAKLRGQGATTAEMLRSVVASFGYDVSLVSVVEHPEEYQFEIVLSDLASVPSDVGGIEAAVNEIKPAHLDYWFTYELAQLLAALRMGGGLWSIQAVTLPPMEEE